MRDQTVRGGGSDAAFVREPSVWLFREEPIVCNCMKII